MGWNKYYIIFLAIFCFIFLGISTTESLAQKNKGKNKEASKLREAEFYFTEGEKYFILEDYAKALVLFQKSLETIPDNATVYYKMAQIYASGQELEKALTNIKEALKLEQNNKYFYVLAADIYTQSGDFKSAAETYEEMLGKLDYVDQYLFELAAIYLYQQRYNEAINTYDRLEKIYGISEEIIQQKQVLYLKLNDVQKALEEGQKLIDSYPGEEKYILKQAEILISANEDQEAREFLQDFLKETPSSMHAHLVLSDLDKKQGDIQGAMQNLEIAFKDPDLDPEAKIQILAEYRMVLSSEELEKSGLKLAKILIETHPEVADVYTVYADMLQTVGHSDEAKNAYIKSLVLDDSNFAVWQNVLQMYIELNELDSVLKLSDRALQLFPNQGALYYYNGAAHLQKKNYDEAIQALEQGKRLSSANLSLISAFNSMLGDAYNGIKNYEKSDRAYEAALDFDPENYPLLNNYSYYLALRKENLEKAEKMAAKTVKNEPDNITYLDTYAWVLFMREKYKEAKKIIEKAIDSGNASAIYYEHYGDILYKLGNVDGAVKQWQVAKGLNPNSELIDKKIADKKLYE